MGIGVKHIKSRGAVGVSASVLLPDVLVKAVVEVEMLHVLELGLGGREQFLDELDVPIHRAADVEEQEHLDGVSPLRTQPDVEIALLGRSPDGRVEIKLLGGPGPGEFSQAAKRDLDVARPELDFSVEILEFALVPHLDGAKIPVSLLADADAFRIIAIGPKGRGACRADPFRAALMTPLLLT